jgi:hypothetical protein
MLLPKYIYIVYYIFHTLIMYISDELTHLKPEKGFVSFGLVWFDLVWFGFLIIELSHRLYEN